MRKDILVSLDMDGVLANHRGEFVKRWNERHPNHTIPQQRLQESYRIYKELPEYKEEMYAILDEPGFYQSLEPIEGAIEGAQYLASRFQVFIDSKPSGYNPNCAWGKKEWVVNHLGKEWREHLILARDKSVVFAHYHVDDSPVIATEGIVKPFWEQIVYDQPYNRHMKNRLRMTWDAVEEIADIIEEEFTRHPHRHLPRA